MLRYTGWLVNTDNSFQFTLSNAKTDSEITIGKEGVLTVKSISRTKIKVSTFDFALQPKVELGVITADLKIIPVHTTNDIVGKLQLYSADGRQQIENSDP